MTPVLMALYLASCATATRDQAWVTSEIERRVGPAITTSGSDAASANPQTGDGIDEDGAVAYALRASPAFQADMARLHVAVADFDAAARPDNPRISLLGPIGPITAAASLVAPIVSFFRIPRRTEAAGRALEAVAESLVQSGLNLVRDVRLAHINCVLAEQRLANLRAQSAFAEDLAGLFELRAAEGDVGPAEARVFRAQAGLAADAVGAAERDRLVAHAVLRNVLGMEADAPEVRVRTSRSLPASTPPIGDLIAVARQARPDVRAAELELEGAALRAGLERTQMLAIALQVDVQWNNSAVGARVGGALDLPVFNQNQGGRGRARAALVAATHRLAIVRQRVTLETTTARAQLAQALASHARYREEIIPLLREVREAATQQYQLGEVSYLVVLDALTRHTSAELRELELEAEVRRAHAELERALGARIEVALPSEEAQP